MGIYLNHLKLTFYYTSSIFFHHMFGCFDI